MNRTRTSTLDAFGLRNQRNRIFPALSASDGSTLDLDFTTMGGVLDSRFTFSRTSNATYINSSGYVAYANSNMVINTAWLDTNTTPTGWSVFNSAGTPAVLTIPSSGRRSVTVTSGVQSFLYQALTIPAGFTHTASIIVHSVTGTGPQLSSLLAINNGTITTYYKNGSSSGISSSTIVTEGTYAITFTGGDQVRLVGGSGTATSTFTVEISSVQIQIGTTISPAFVPNTSTSAAYYAPRFDYNPTTLAANGLLIESAATNVILNSNNISNWLNSNIVTPTTDANLSPAGTATDIKNVVPSTTNTADHRIFQSITLTTATVYTFSFFFKPNGYNFLYVFDNSSGSFSFVYNMATQTAFSVTAGTVAAAIAYPNGWYKLQVTFTTLGTGCVPLIRVHDAISVGAYSGNGTSGALLWGFQIELGKAASSYIPTVASQVTRAIDSCTFAVTPANISLTSAPPATFCYSATVNAIPTSGFPTIIGFQDSGGTTRVFRSQINSTTSNYVSWLPTGVTTTEANEITFSTLAQGVSFKLASSITSTFVTASRNGVAATAVSVGATYSFVAPDKIVFGILASNVAFTIANFKFFPIAKSQAELNALTT